MKYLLPFSLDVIAPPFYSPYTPTGLFLIAGLVIAAIAGTAVLLICLFGKK